MSPETPAAQSSGHIDQMLDRINHLVSGNNIANVDTDQVKLQEELDKTDFVPVAPESLEQTKLNAIFLQEIILKYLLATGEAS